MTREELLKEHIFVPSSIDESIIINLLMGNSVLCKYHDYIIHMDVPVCLTPSARVEISPIKHKFEILKNFEDRLIITEQSMFGPIVYVDNVFSNYFLNNAQIKDILKYF